MKLSLISEHPCHIRIVDKTLPSYINLMESIYNRGVVVPIMVAPRERKFVIVDGLRRHHASLDLGLTTIPTFTKDVSDSEFEEMQLLQSVHSIPTRPIEMTNALIRMLSREDETLASLTDKLKCSTKWIENRLKLNLHANLQYYFANGRLSLVKAYIASKLPPCEQLNIDWRMPAKDYVNAVMVRVKELKK